MPTKMTASEPCFHVLRAADIELNLPPGMETRSMGLKRAALTGRHNGAVHTGFALAQLNTPGRVDSHLHSTEQSFYILSGHPSLTIGGATYRLSAGECGLIPVGVTHSWHNVSDEPATFVEANAPAPRLTGPPDTFWTGDPVPTGAGDAPDIRDPRTRNFFKLGPGQMDVDNLKIGSAVNAPTVSASIATALLGYSGIAVKTLVDQRLGAVLHSLSMVEYQPGGSALPHDHPLEESCYMLEGEVVATANDEEFMLGPGDFFWTGVGCIHAFENRSGQRVCWLETQSPQLPSDHSYRFNRDWNYLQDRLTERLGRTK
jgi:mannose-6-phosphate isomerase-like protein (cupin superfamily)